MKLSKRHILLTVIVITFVLNVHITYGDTGPKPTLNIFVENIDDSKYYLDLLGSENDYGYFGATDGNEKYNNLHDQPIYKYDKDGYKAIMMRTWLLSGKLEGEPYKLESSGKVLTMKHAFGYVGVPKKFKIIIQKSDGSIQVSDVINNDNFNAVVRYDMKANKVISIKGDFFDKGAAYNGIGFSEFIMRILLTLLVELVIALPFYFRNLRRIPVIAGVNIITQSLLTLMVTVVFPVASMFFRDSAYFIVLVVGEVLVLLAEYIIYLKIFGKKEKGKTAAYTAIANLASFLAGGILL